MEVKTNVFLSENDIRAIIKKHLEKTGFKVIGELEIITRNDSDRNYNKQQIPKGQKIGINAEVQKIFKNRISLPNK